MIILNQLMSYHCVGVKIVVGDVDQLVMGKKAFCV